MKKQTKRNKEETLIKSKNSSQGITLIALVITIIVLLILAAVSIATLTGENGILTQASTARDKTKEGELEERAKLILTNWNFEKGTGKTFEEYLNEHFDTVVNNGDGTYTVTLEEYEMTVDEEGNVIIKGEGQEEEKVEPTDIYVTLYTDGTLGFSNDETTIEGKTVQESYGNIRGKKFTFSTTCPWENNTSITSVVIVNEIAPTYTSYWFYGLRNLTQIENIDNLLTANLTDTGFMFANCESLTSLDLNSFNTKNVTNMWYMFSGCENLRNLKVNKFNTSNVTNMEAMFYGCSSLTSLDVTNFNTNLVTSMYRMFYSCSSLTNLDLSRFNTINVTDMLGMFDGCQKLTSLNVKNFDTSNGTRMNTMFQDCSSLISLDLTNFRTSKVTNMVQMFKGCSNLERIYVSKEKWVTENAETTNIFRDCKVNYFTAEDGSTFGI